MEGEPQSKRRRSSRAPVPRRFSSSEEGDVPIVLRPRGRPPGSKNRSREELEQRRGRGRGRGGRGRGQGRKPKPMRSQPIPFGKELPSLSSSSSSSEESQSDDERVVEKNPRQPSRILDSTFLAGGPRAITLNPRLDSTIATTIPYGVMKHDVEEELPGMMDIWLDYLSSTDLPSKFWGLYQPEGFVSHSLTMALYKDLTGKGYQKILDTVDLGFKITNKSFQHNTQLIRVALYRWACVEIKSGSERDWNAKKHLLPKKKGLEDVNLILDSTDFRLIGKSSISKKDPSWSYKLNAPGQRYQCLMDAELKCVGLWGGYSPKTYDGEWVDYMKNDLKHDYPGARIIADTHYETANTAMASVDAEEVVQFFTPFSKPRGPKGKKRDPSQGLKVLTQKQKTWNNSISHIRGRIESPFGLIKQKWKGLDLFYEGEEQQNYLVSLAVATLSFTK
jgi:DDE superfamily endonuclease